MIKNTTMTKKSKKSDRKHMKIKPSLRDEPGYNGDDEEVARPTTTKRVRRTKPAKSRRSKRAKLVKTRVKRERMLERRLYRTRNLILNTIPDHSTKKLVPQRIMKPVYCNEAVLSEEESSGCETNGDRILRYFKKYEEAFKRGNPVVMKRGTTASEIRFEEALALWQSRRYPNVSPELVRKEYIEVLPKLKERIAHLDRNAEMVVANVELFESNLRMLEQKCNEYECHNFSLMVLGHEKLKTSQVRNDQLLTSITASTRQLYLMRSSFQEQRSANAAACRNGVAASLEHLIETLTSRINEITFQTAKCEEIISDKRKDLATAIKKKHIEIKDFEKELISGRKVYKKLQRQSMIKNLPSEFIELSVEEYANGKIFKMCDNCDVLIISFRRMDITLGHCLDRWNSMIEDLRQDPEEIHKKIADIDTVLQFWENSIREIGRNFNLLREEIMPSTSGGVY